MDSGRGHKSGSCGIGSWGRVDSYEQEGYSY